MIMDDIKKARLVRHISDSRNYDRSRRGRTRIRAIVDVTVMGVFGNPAVAAQDVQ